MEFGGLRTKGIKKSSLHKKPLISVITVVYNGEKTLEKTITSVLNQTYDNIEYIIIDGASKDGTKEIIKKYDNKIDYWITEPDNGIYDAMNKGVSLATGDWLNFMNSGDLFYTNTVLEELFQNQFEDLRNKDVLYGQIIDNGKIIKPYPLFTMPIVTPFCHQASFVSKKMFELEHFNTKYKIISDWIFFYRLKKKGAVFLNMRNVICEYENGGVSSNYSCLFSERKDFLLSEKRYILVCIWLLYLKIRGLY